MAERVPASDAPRRILALDGLRGLAALAVVFSHVATMTYFPGVARDTGPSWWEYGLWHLGAPAVDLFFVLSGLVVARAALRYPLLPFLARRWLRLAPLAYIGVLAGVFVIRPLGAELPGGVGELLREPPRVHEVLGGLTLVWPFDANRLNPPLWTLVVELHVAALMPLFARIRQLGPVIAVGVIGYLAYQYTPLWTAAYFMPFALGAWLSHQRPLPGALVPTAALLGLGLLLSRHLLGSNALELRYVCAAGAALLVAAVLAGSGRGFLEHRATQWLGRVSYPLYAVHYAALLIGASLLPDPTLGALLAIPLALLFAWALTVAVEEPLLRRMARRRAAVRNAGPVTR